MSQDTYRTDYPSGQSSSTAPTTSTAGSTAQTAKDQAASVAGSAAQSGAHLVDETKTQVAEVGREAGRQARAVLDQSRTQLTEQAAHQQRSVAGGLRSFSGELSTMAAASSQPGVATDLVQQVATRAGSMATWLDEREPGDLLEEVKTFARNRPGTFLAIAAAAGLLAGRLTRGLKDGSSDAATRPTHRAPAALTTTGSGADDTASYPTGATTSSTWSTSTGSTSGTYATGAGATGAGTTAGGVYSESVTGTGIDPLTGAGTAYPTYPPAGAASALDAGTDEYGQATVGERTASATGEADSAWPPVHGTGDER